MKIDIVAIEDENFKIEVSNFGVNFLASDGERVCVKPTPEEATQGVSSLQQGIDPSDPTAPPATNAAPLENSRDGHPFDFFGGTSWAGKKQEF